MTTPSARKRLAAVTSLLLLLFAVSSIAEAQTAQEVARKSFRSVVLLAMEDAKRQPVSLGSGFIVREGVIATNLHVIRGASNGYAKLVGEGKKYDIEGTVGIDIRRDLALLKVSGGLAASLPLGDSKSVAVGDQVYVVGNPQGLEGTFSQGIVSGIRTIGEDKLLQITAPISPGSSGGPVLNTRGEVIGVAVATFKGGQNLNFAIPASYLTSMLSSLKPVAPFAKGSGQVGGKSILADLGGRSTEGVVGAQFAWAYPGIPIGYYSFSLRNQLRDAIKNVYCLVVFYDPQGNPVDVAYINYSGVIPPGLAKRVSSNVDGSVQKLTAKVEFRVLDFQIRE